MKTVRNMLECYEANPIGGTKGNLMEALQRVYRELAENQEQLEPEFQKAIDDNFWELFIGE